MRLFCAIHRSSSPRLTSAAALCHCSVSIGGSAVSAPATRRSTAFSMAVTCCQAGERVRAAAASRCSLSMSAASSPISVW
ncbi:Uncharacterised protein [Mycobacteroides abscessus subsp. abscessus]|nr:Uncharacterised protein [Mycobacteroides abscessus subsp. abscessus]